MDELLERYRAFRGHVDRFREGSDRPDPQLRAVYDAFMAGMEWKDARASFSLYCRLNRTLHAPFVEELFALAAHHGTTLSGATADFRGGDAVRTIGSWMLGTPVPSAYDVRAEGDGGAAVLTLFRVERGETRFLLLNPPEEETLAALAALVALMERRRGDGPAEKVIYGIHDVDHSGDHA